MAEELDFSLPTRGPKAVKSKSTLLPVLMTAVLIAVLANITIVLVQKDRSKNRTGAAVLSAKKQKQLALKLEKQGLNTASVVAWREYLGASSPDDEAAARVWYRMGKLFQMENQYAMALDSFYRSESFAKLDDISSEIARRIQDCLESMGKFTALRYELTERVGMRPIATQNYPDAAGDEVVAEIGPQRIMKSDLAHRIEHQINRQVSQLRPYLPEKQIKIKKEELLKQYSTDSQKQVFLNQYILEEVLYRKARESRLTDDAEVRAALKDMERSLLAGKVLEKAFAEEIKITVGDLETYYKAHRQEYVHPKRAKVSHILVRNNQEAEDVRKRIKKGEKFSALAASASLDESTRKSGGELSEWIEKNETGFVPGIGSSEDAMRLIFSTEVGKVADENIKTDKGIHIFKVLDSEPERQKTFEEAKNAVFISLRSRKEMETQQELLAKLKEQYDVVIHHSAFNGRDESSKGSSQ